MFDYFRSTNCIHIFRDACYPYYLPEFLFLIVMGANLFSSARIKMTLWVRILFFFNFMLSEGYIPSFYATFMIERMTCYFVKTNFWLKFPFPYRWLCSGKRKLKYTCIFPVTCYESKINYINIVISFLYHNKHGTVKRCINM